MRTFAFSHLCAWSPTASCQFCDDNQRLAIPLHDPECGYEYLYFLDPVSGAILEDLEQPKDWLAELPHKRNRYTKGGEPYRGEILVCADGKRIIQRTADRKGGWQWRHRTAKGWCDGPAITTRLEDVCITPKGWERAWRANSMAASADGETVVVSGVLHGNTGPDLPKGDRRLFKPDNERYITEFEAEVWSIDKRGKVTAAPGIPPVRLRDDEDPIMAVSSGPETLIAVGTDGRVVVCGLSGVEIASLKMPAPPKPSRPSHEEPKASLRFSDNAQQLVGHFWNVVIAWDTTNWKQTKIKLEGKTKKLVAVSPNGESIAVAETGGVVRFFDAATGAPGTVITPPQTPLLPISKDDTPVALCFSSDGLMCMLGLANGSVAIWDVDS